MPSGMQIVPVIGAKSSSNGTRIGNSGAAIAMDSALQ